MSGFSTNGKDFLLRRVRTEICNEFDKNIRRHFCCMDFCHPFLLCFGGSHFDAQEPILRSNDQNLSVSKFSDVYELREKLGEGGYANVMKAVSVKNKARRPVAVKIVSKENLKAKDELALRKEFEILTSLNHSNIVQAFEFFEEKDFLYVVLEYLEGGELFDRIVKKTRYNEAEAREVVCSLLAAVKYCHDNDTIHRDLKPENLLLTSVNDDASVKLADFGLALKLDSSDFVMVSKAGTPDYVSPEVIQGQPIGKPVDMWSFGVIMFILLGGYPPFHDSNQKVLFNKICLGSFQFHPKRWSNVSEQAKDMIKRLLTVNPNDRLTASQAISHAWVTQERTVLANNSLDENLPELKKFNASRKLRVGIKAVMAANSFMKISCTRDGDGTSLSTSSSVRPHSTN